jgi:hypothetical protein
MQEEDAEEYAESSRNSGFSARIVRNTVAEGRVGRAESQTSGGTDAARAVVVIRCMRLYGHYRNVAYVAQFPSGPLSGLRGGSDGGLPEEAGGTCLVTGREHDQRR